MERTEVGDQKIEVTRANLNAERINGSSRHKDAVASTRGAYAPQIEHPQTVFAQFAEIVVS